MDVWELMRWIHLLAMAMFAGGQLTLAAVVVPVLRGHEKMRAVARSFGVATVGAIGIAVLTGMLMASQFDSWDEFALHAKLGLLVVAGVLIFLHTRRAGSALLSAALLVVSLAITWFGVALAHA